MDFLKLIFGRTQQILGIVFQILGLASDAATSLEVTQVAEGVGGLNTILTAEPYSLILIKADTGAIDGEIINATNIILAAIADLTNGVTPVVPTTPPPTGYGGPTTSDVSAAVWGDTAGYPSGSKGSEVYLSYAIAFDKASLSSAPMPFAPLFYLLRNWTISGSSLPSDAPNPDLANILVTDTASVFLTREVPGLTWLSNVPGPGDVFAESVAETGNGYLFVYNETTFRSLVDLLYPPTNAQGASLWPGIANVTLGTPVAIDVGVTVAVPMDGCIISITSVPSKQGQFNFDTATSWRNIGALSFYDDNGEQEFPQTLGFADCVYCPQSMETASGLRLRSSAGVEGTITPWTRV